MTPLPAPASPAPSARDWLAAHAYPLDGLAPRFPVAPLYVCGPCEVSGRGGHCWSCGTPVGPGTMTAPLPANTIPTPEGMLSVAQRAQRGRRS